MKDGVIVGGAGAWTDDEVGAAVDGGVGAAVVLAKLSVDDGLEALPGMEAMVLVPGVLGGGGGTVSVMVLCLEWVCLNAMSYRTTSFGIWAALPLGQ